MAINLSAINNGGQGITPVNIDPDAIRMKNLQLKQAEQGAALGQEQLKSAQLHNAAVEKEAADRKQAQDVLNQHLDSDATYQKLLSVNPKMAEDWRKATHQKLVDDLAIKKGQLEQAGTVSKQLSSLLGPVALALQSGDTAKATELYQVARNSALSNPLLAQAAQDAPPALDPNYVMTHFNAAIDADKQVGNALAQTQFQHKVAAEDFDQKYKVADLNARVDNNKAIREQSAAQFAETQRHNRVAESQGAQRIAAEREKAANDPNNVDITNANPSDLRAAQMAAAGKLGVKDLPTRGGYRQRIATLANQLDPTFTTTRKEVMDQFRKGKDADDLKNLVMLNSHMDRFAKNSEDVGLTGRINPFSTADTRLQTDANDVSGIMGRLTKGGMLTVQEHREYMDRLLSKQPSKRAAAVDELKELLAGKIEGLKNKYENGTGMKMPEEWLGSAQKFDETQPKAKASGFNPSDARKKYNY